MLVDKLFSKFGWEPSEIIVPYLNHHFELLREDRCYAKRFNVYLRERFAEVEPDFSVKGTRVRGSELSECPRKIYYRLTGAPSEPITRPDWAFVARIGDYIHAELQAALVFNNLVPPQNCEYKVENDIVAGRIDILWPPDIVADIKTVNQDAFAGRKRDQKLASYEAQLAVYTRLIGGSLAVIILVNRNTGELCEFKRQFEEKEQIFWLNKAEEIFSAKTPPQRQFNPETHYFCQKLCPYREICIGENADEKEGL